MGDLLADLVSRRENEPFLVRLFDRAAGDWALLCELCSDLPHVVDAIAELGADAQPMAWLADPFAARRSGYCLVSIYSDEHIRCDVALYNRARLTRGQDRPA